MLQEMRINIVSDLSFMLLSTFLFLREYGIIDLMDSGG